LRRFAITGALNILFGLFSHLHSFLFHFFSCI
jgi:hypothetical protein